MLLVASLALVVLMTSDSTYSTRKQNNNNTYTNTYKRNKHENYVNINMLPKFIHMEFMISLMYILIPAKSENSKKKIEVQY